MLRLPSTLGLGFGGEVGLGRIGQKNDVGALTTAAGTARPRTGGRVVRHTVSDQGEFHVAVAMQHIAFAVDQAGFVEAPHHVSVRRCRAPIGPASPRPSVYMRRAMGSVFEGVPSRWTWLASSTVGVQAAAGVPRRLVQQCQATRPIVIADKAELAMVARLTTCCGVAGRSRRGCLAIVLASAQAGRPGRIGRRCAFACVGFLRLSESERDPGPLNLFRCACVATSACVSVSRRLQWRVFQKRSPAGR